MKSKKFLLMISSLIILSIILITACDNRVLEQPDYNIVYMRANPDTIYSDNNITYSEIEVKVKDEDGFAVTNETVTFRSDIGNLIYEVQTDSMGIAQTTFWDNGELGLATVEAFVADKVASVAVAIEEVPEIETLNLNFNSSQLNIDETTLIRAVCQNEVGNVPDGTLIVFETDLGFFQSLTGNDLGTATQVSTSNGVAKVNFNASSQKGKANITSTVGGVSVSDEITIHPGSPKHMYLTPEVNQIQANSGQDVLITARVEDKYHNAVESGVGVDFTTDLGSVNEFDNTDSLGIAETIFSPGLAAGSALIEAVADSAQASTVISIISDDVYSIEFAFSGQVDIQVAGTGGQESFEFQVNLYDVNGNLIDYPETVWFKFMNGPDGTNINNQVFLPSDDSLSVESSNGHAIVSISSGLESGTVTLQAYAYNDVDNIVSATKSNIVVHSGPPSTVDISIGGHDTGEDMGGGVWQVECAAFLNDTHGNPVDYATAVYFSLDENISFASIYAPAYVGNENANGDSTDGVAFTRMNYEGTHTNDDITIYVEVSNTIPGQPNFTDSTTVVLPIQFPTIDITAVPSHVDWYEIPSTTPEYQSTEVRLTVKDGQNNPIDNQIVHFSSTLGYPLEPTPPDTGDPYTGLTTVIDGEHGRLNKEVEFYYGECPAPVPAPPGTTTATITAQLLGTQTSNQVTIILNRYVD